MNPARLAQIKSRLTLGRAHALKAAATVHCDAPEASQHIAAALRQVDAALADLSADITALSGVSHLPRRRVAGLR